MPFSPQTTEIRLNNLEGQKTMTNAQHTPGKWSAQKIAMSGNYLINTTENDGNTFTIAQFTKSINMCGKRKIEHEANARLIAAAPELLAALQHILAANLTIEQRAIVCKAIAKAEGSAE